MNQSVKSSYFGLNSSVGAFVLFFLLLLYIFSDFFPNKQVVL
jgi:hypothetical protein